MRRTKRGGWPYGHPPNIPFEINRDSPQVDGLVLWMPWGGGTPGAHSRHVDRVSGLVFTEGGTPVWVADGERGWSLLFDDAANEYLEVGTAVVTGPPLTMACWAWWDDVSVATPLFLMGVLDKAVHNEYHSLIVQGGLVGDPVMAQSRSAAAGSVSAITTTGFIVNTWHHCCGIWSAANSRAAFIDSGSKGTNAVACTPAGLDRTAISGRRNSAAAYYWSGRISDVRIYNRALTDTEVKQLYYEPWELWKPRLRRFLGWRSPGPPPVGGHMTLWGRYWGP